MVYAGKETLPSISIASKVVMDLMEQHLDIGRTSYVDKWYSSLTLARKLLERGTFLVVKQNDNGVKMEISMSCTCSKFKTLTLHGKCDAKER